MVRPRAVVWSAGLMFGALAALVGPSTGCILPDQCTVLYSLGNNWCAPMMGAIKWPIDQPELAEAILSDSYSVPTGCICVNDVEHGILDAQTPTDAYLLLRADLVVAARENCLVLSEGFANNCLTESGPMSPTFAKEKQDSGQTGPCVGDCKFITPPVFGECPDDPDPFECEDLIEPGSDDEAGGDCPIGAQGCPCTVGGACDRMLMCLDGICVAMSSDDEQGDLSPVFEIEGRVE